MFFGVQKSSLSGHYRYIEQILHIVDYLTRIVYTEQYAVNILHFRILFCTTKKFRDYFNP
ncbi:hypothetical protein [Pseudoplusia includens SNPV IE]|uniref:Uncharacterized protein n=2 Tax=Chrysodeixis includens nucleopolyhedrovirus TaxID=1207438 RepID=A0A1C8ZYA5_9ABAC|nr:hypothetical protein [Pseudoplusia includens SNPV IE]AOL56584.1 hypothetical protein [Chrysodeixis includens nucleopolyhedrovirus]AJD80696.1 hypothetical protein [Pseudoplusia includens SNPV IE]AOL56867.1 hypothetical protein [Chrysodeixis includens nucleopolyhedrovirus]AOL57009.1 hypothetical protein [Chrysodeixis includens nucleopolyhedrovirus]AOL57150.1 hypothetical protein [Chrysodeixis includens nucleopolyhedrovirus]